MTNDGHSISDGHSLSVISELSVNASEGAHVAEYIKSRELDSFLFPEIRIFRIFCVIMVKTRI